MGNTQNEKTVTDLTTDSGRYFFLVVVSLKS